MRRRPTADMACSVAKASDVIGDPWTLLVLRDALLGVRRFDDWVDRLGIPRATLSARLSHLVHHGVLARDGEQYVLTAKGRALQPVIIAVMQWGDRWQRDDDPPTTFVDDDSGRIIEPVLVDRSTSTPLEQIRLRAVGEVTRGIRPD